MPNEKALQTYNQYLGLAKEFVNPPTARLELATARQDGTPISSRSIATSSAIQCYNPGVSEMIDRNKPKEIKTADSTLDAGHLTTRQHAYWTWKIAASRMVVHDIVNANPYSNSEQQSQRYAEAREGNYLLPAGLTLKQEEAYKAAADHANRAYFELLAALKPTVAASLEQQHTKHTYRNVEQEKRLVKKADKICQEVARYALPVGQATVLDHTLSALSLIRLFAASEQYQFTAEAKYLIAKMIEEVAKVDPSILDELRVSNQSTASKPPRDSKEVEVFDSNLGGRSSKLLGDGASKRAELLKISQLNNSDLADLLDPRKNPHLADVIETSIHDPQIAILKGLNLNFATKLSHTADSQRQRQRTTPGVTPTWADMYNGTPDYFVPMLIKKDEQLLKMYTQRLGRLYELVEDCLATGIKKEQTMLLLPNAHNLRLTETGDLFGWIHRFKQRLCYLAQEEIFFVSVDQVEQVLEFLPEASKVFQAPCGLRQVAGISPRCPEGDRFCGQPVFRWDLNNYRQHRLV